MRWTKSDSVDLALQLVGMVIAVVCLIFLGPLYGAPKATDRPWFYVSSVGAGLALGYLIRWCYTTWRKRVGARPGFTAERYGLPIIKE